MCDEPSWPALPFGVERDPHLRTTGENQMLVPLRFVAGRAQAPGLASQSNPNTGFFDEGDGLAYSQDGVKLWRADELGAGGGPSFSAVNGAGYTIHQGQPVRQHTDGTLRLAQANSLSNEAIGLAGETIANGVSGLVICSGPLEVADWTNALGSASLTVQARYYLVPSTPGLITDSYPTSNPDTLQFCGTAISAQTILVRVESAIGL